MKFTFNHSSLFAKVSGHTGAGLEYFRRQGAEKRFQAPPQPIELPGIPKLPPSPVPLGEACYFVASF